MTVFAKHQLLHTLRPTRLASARWQSHEGMMTKKSKSITGKAAVAGAAIGSAAIAAALLYASKKREEKARAKNPDLPHIDPPETD